MSGWGNRCCAGCGQDLERREYSRNQWLKGIGNSRCRICVQENVDPDSAIIETSRSNNFSRAVRIDFENIIGEGTFRYVALGRYIKGQRTNQPCVAKWFKANTGMNQHVFFSKDLSSVTVAMKIITSWNSAYFINPQIRINSPEVWRGYRSEGDLYKNADYGEYFLVEPFIENFEKFNSNTGWVNTDHGSWYLIMQALSHYSYHVSSGQYLLCDLQGGVSRLGAILTDPVIMSQHREFGLTDLGSAGMSTFFSQHECNQYCRQSWTRPKVQRQFYMVRQGSVFEAL